MSTSTAITNPSLHIPSRASVIDIGRFLPRTGDRARGARSRASRIQDLSLGRNLVPFELLRRIVLPSVVASGQRQIHLAVAGRCTAHQAFGLAITVCEHFPELAAWDIRLFVENPAEATRPHAGRGCFQHLDSKQLPLPLLLKYFECKPGFWQASERLRSMLHFRGDSVFTSTQPFDLVLLQDASEHLSLPQQNLLFTAVHHSLRPHGIVIGDRRSLDRATELFRPGAEGPCGFYRPIS